MGINDIHSLIENYFAENGMIDCYVVEIKQNGKKIEVYIDKDGGITFDICHKVSRFIESILDENLAFGEDYILEVSSPGVGSGLKLTRQYKNNIGRTIEIKTEDDKARGVITKVDDESVTISYEEITKEGKKKIKTQIEKTVKFTDILEAKIKIVF